MLANKSTSERDEIVVSEFTDERTRRRRVIRYFAAVVSGLTAVMYFLIGFNVVSVLDANADQSWGLLAGVAYAIGALLLLAFDRRIVWILGAFLQVFVIYTYFNLAGNRSPAYEVWGILIRIAQSMILIALAYLVVNLQAQALPFDSIRREEP
jgi:hypothetical protein